MKRKKEKTQINKISDEKEAITTNTMKFRESLRNTSKTHSPINRNI
jgi:hypothetical protein